MNDPEKYDDLIALLMAGEQMHPVPTDRVTLPQTVTLERWAWDALNRGEPVTLTLYRP